MKLSISGAINSTSLFTSLSANSAERLVISDGTIESLKWLALISMTCSHVNYVLFNSKLLPFLTEIGCIAFPLFGFVLAYNLARPNSLKNGLHVRAMKRMFLFGLLTIPLYVSALPTHVKGWLPLNIMFTLMLATGIIWLLEDDGYFSLLLASIVFIFAGAFVSGHWFCIGYCLAAWYFCKKPSMVSLFVWIASTVSLGFVFPGNWGLLAIPTIFMATKFNFKLPRLRLAFYAYYPTHFVVLIAIKMLMGRL